MYAGEQPGKESWRWLNPARSRASLRRRPTSRGSSTWVDFRRGTVFESILRITSGPGPIRRHDDKGRRREEIVATCRHSWPADRLRRLWPNLAIRVGLEPGRRAFLLPPPTPQAQAETASVSPGIVFGPGVLLLFRVRRRRLRELFAPVVFPRHRLRTLRLCRGVGRNRPVDPLRISI